MDEILRLEIEENRPGDLPPGAAFALLLVPSLALWGALAAYLLG